jgi:glycine cleavage system H protein
LRIELKKFAKTHEWALPQDGEARVGISSYAKNELGTIVYAELPKVGTKVKKGDEIAILESTKAAADIYSPLSGTIIAINSELKEDMNLLNGDPENRGWLYQIALSDESELSDLMDLSTYTTQVVCAE